MAAKTRKSQINAKSEAIGVEGIGDFYLIEVKPASEFKAFRYHTVGDPGHIIRVAGLGDNDEWADHAWIVSKQDAHVEDQFLKADTKHAQQVLDITGPAHHVADDIFIRQLLK
jgi:hypothetical protein